MSANNPYPFFSKRDWLIIESAIEIWLKNATPEMWAKETIEDFKKTLEKVKFYADLS